MEKRTLVRDLAVVVKRLPFVDKTNKLEEVTKVFQKHSDKRGMENSKPYFKNKPLYSNTSKAKGDPKKENATIISGKRVRKKTLPCRGCNCNLESMKSLADPVKFVEKADGNISTTSLSTSPSGSESASETVITTLGKRIRKHKSPCNGCNCTSQQSPSSTLKSLRMPDEKVAITKSNRSVSAKEIITKKIDKDLCHDNKFKMHCKVLIENVNISKQVKMSSNKTNSEDDAHSASTSTVTDCKSADSNSACHLIMGEETHKNLAKDTSENEQNKRLIPAMPAKFLRQQIRPNYAEITLDTSQEKTVFNTPEIKIVTKVPVYKQQIEDKTSKVPDNLYEFDESDSDRDKQQRKRKRFRNKSRKRNIPLSTAKSKISRQRKGYNVLKDPSRKYNEIMQEIIQKVMVKVNSQHKPAPESADKSRGKEQGVNKPQVQPCKISTGSTSNKQEDKGVLKSNIKPETLAPSSEGLSATDKMFNVVKVPAQKVLIVNVTNIPHLKFLEISSENIKIQDKFKAKADRRRSNKENIPPIDRGTIVEGSSGDIFPPELEISKKNAEKESFNGSSDIFPEEASNHEKNTDLNFLNVQFQASTSKKKSTQTVPELSVRRDSSEDLFPFEINTESLPEQNNLERPLSPSSKIDDEENLGAGDVIDSDYDNRSEQGTLDDSFLNLEGSPSKTVPKINIIGNVVINRVKHNPWRFNDYIRRNPHFILLKTTALPCLKQDMVLDHNQVEKIEEHFSKTPRRVETPRKSPVQKSMLDYINVPDNDRENQPRSSLFDYNDFSPIKMKSLQQGDVKNRAKRNILAPIQDNALNIGPFTSTPNTSNRKKVSFNPTSIGYDENEDIANYFGFGDDDGDNAASKGARKRSEDKPYRIYGKVRKENLEEVEDLEESVPVEEHDESQAAVNSMDVVLFEDPEKDFSLNVPSKIYVRKPRRKRLKSVEVENDENHPKKRKKDMMTKAEEAELENWAAEFNSMCAEIDKYDLEIE